MPPARKERCGEGGGPALRFGLQYDGNTLVYHASDDCPRPSAARCVVELMVFIYTFTDLVRIVCSSQYMFLGSAYAFCASAAAAADDEL